MAKTILITGTSSGIGRVTAQYFQSQGWNVVATMRDPQKETELNQLDNVLVTELDVLKPDTIQTSINSAIEQFGAVDALVNNAGFGVYGPLEMAPMDKVKDQFDVNVFGLISTIQAILPHFRQKRSGMIINISSVVGKMGAPFGSLYHGSKFAVEGISESLAYELEPFGITVKIVEPGPSQTEFAGGSMALIETGDVAEYEQGLAMSNRILKSLMQDQGVKPEEVAETIFEAASDGSSTLRYPAGEYAKFYTQKRQNEDDATFIGDFRANLKALQAA